jgi:hypothetical protein
VASNQLLTLGDVQQALDILRGAVMIVYPMGLPPHDPITMEMNNEEDLSGTQASLDVSAEFFLLPLYELGFFLSLSEGFIY